MKLIDKLLKVLKTDRNTFFTYILTLVSIYLVVDRMTELLLLGFTGLSISYWGPFMYTFALACPVFAFLFCYSSKFVTSDRIKVSFFYLYVTALYIIALSMFVQWGNTTIWSVMMSLPGYPEVASNFPELFKPALTSLALYLPLTTFYPLIKWLYTGVNDSKKFQDSIADYAGINLAKVDKDAGLYSCEVAFARDKVTGATVKLSEQGRFNSLLIVGPSGSGKTSLLFEPMIAADIDKKHFFKEIAKEMGFTALKTGLANLNCPYGNDYVNKNFNLNMLSANSAKSNLYNSYMKKMIINKSGDHYTYRNLGMTVMSPDFDLIDHMMGVANNYDMPFNLIDPNNPDSPGLNPFVFDDPKQTAIAISSVLKGMYVSSASDTEMAFRENISFQVIENIAILLKEMYPRLNDGLLPNLEDLLKMLNDFDLVEEMTEQMKRFPELVAEYSIQIGFFEKNFYANSNGRNDMQRYVSATISQLDGLLRYPGVKNILCNRYNNINYDDSLANGEITFVCTRRGDLGASAHKAFGLFFLLLMQFSVLRRPGNENSRIPHMLYIDEFPDFACSSTEVFFTTYRKYKVATTISSQNLAQLGQESEKVKQIILSNCASKIALGNNSPEENAWWEKEFGEKREWQFSDAYNTDKGSYDPKLGGIKYGFTQNFKSGKIQSMKFKRCAYKLRNGGSSQIGEGILDFMPSKYKEKHPSKSYNFGKFTSGISSDDTDTKSSNRRSSKFGTPHFDDMVNENDEIDPIMMNNSDTKFLYDNEDAIIFDLKRGNPNQ